MPTNVSPLQLFARIVGNYFPSLVVRPEVAERMYPLSKFLNKIILESGYFHLQATKPDTIGKLFFNNYWINMMNLYN